MHSSAMLKVIAFMNCNIVSLFICIRLHHTAFLHLDRRDLLPVSSKILRLKKYKSAQVLNHMRVNKYWQNHNLLEGLTIASMHLYLPSELEVHESRGRKFPSVKSTPFFHVSAELLRRANWLAQLVYVQSICINLSVSARERFNFKSIAQLTS